MNDKKSHFTRHEGGISLTNKDGLNMGMQFDQSANEYITFVNCRKNGVPIGPDWGWFLDGRRYYFNLWDKNGSGRLLRWRTWTKNGKEDDSLTIHSCKMCKNKITADDSTHFGCGHRFHYDCATEWLCKKSSCPICYERIICASSPRNVRWLCMAIARNFSQKMVLVRDIFGNETWIRFKLQTNLPGFYNAPNIDIEMPSQFYTLITVDSGCNVMCLKTPLGKVYMGNVIPLFDAEEFVCEYREFLRNSSLIGNPRMLQVVQKEDFA